MVTSYAYIHIESESLYSECCMLFKNAVLKLNDSLNSFDPLKDAEWKITEYSNGKEMNLIFIKNKVIRNNNLESKVD
ncbi:MAG: hypothetical protein PHE43_03940 [Candidatus Nanoarchaeia archaeon]|nr:hypothetical protein [Candidatus Nanoarchaeia archaeon]